MRIQNALMVFLLFLTSGCVSKLRTPSPRNPSSEAAGLSSRCEALDHFQVQGHRGAWDRPENMISAFQRGVELGADMVELDLQITRDGSVAEDQVVVAHDPFLRSNCLDPQGSALGKQKLYFRQMSLNEIRRYNCGTKANPEAVATLAEVFAALQNLHTRTGEPVGINVELKYDPNHPEYFPARERYVSLMLEVLDHSHFETSRLLFQSFDLPILKILRQRRPDLEISPLLGGKEDVERAVEIARDLQTTTVTPTAAFLNAELVRKIQSAGIRVVPWTVNDTTWLGKLLDWKTDGVITDHPEMITFARSLCR